MDRRTIFALALSALALAAHARDNALVMAPGNRAFSLELPESSFSQAGAALSIDLDGYDVSPFSRVDGETLHIDLETPLSSGQHSLNVLLFLPNGDVEVLLDALMDVPELEGGQWSLNTTLETNYRAAQHQDPDFQGVDRATNSGSLSFAGSRDSGNWRFASAVDAIYDGYNDVGPGSESWLLPSYELSATWLGANAETSAAAGNIRIDRDDLLFSRFQRRGAAMETVATSGAFDLQLFSVVSSPRNAFDGDYLTPGDSHDHTRGVSGSVRLVEDYLQIGGGFIDGNTALGGAGFNTQDDTAIYGGDSWNVAADSRWMKGSVWLHFEHAKSEFDADGIGVGLPALKDDATEARLRLSSAGRFGEGPFAYWSVDLRHKRVGWGFYSVGNLSQAGNIEVDSALLQGGFDSVVIDVELSRQRSNPQDDPQLATQMLERAGVSLSYTPADLDPGNRLWKALGAPSLTGWLYRSDSSQPDADALIAGFDLDNRTDEAGLALMFAREELTFGLEFGVVDYADSSEAVMEGGFVIYEPLPDSRNVQTSLQSSWVPSERVMLDAYLQWNRLEESDLGNEYRTTNYGLSGTFFLLPERLSLHTSFNQGQERRSFGDLLFLPENFRSRVATAQLNWLLSPASGRYPGLSLFVKGNYARNEDLGFVMDHEIWSMYVGAIVSWAKQ